MRGGRRNPQEGELGDLVVHQTDQRGDDQAALSRRDGGVLVTEGFAGPGRHNGQDVAALQGGLDDFLLARPEHVEAEYGTQRRFEGSHCRLDNSPVRG
jgi:hypothetical protein